MGGNDLSCPVKIIGPGSFVNKIPDSARSLLRFNFKSSRQST